MSEMMAVITAMEFPRDLQGAEAMMSRWKEHRAEVDSRKEAVKKFLESGQVMIDEKHFLSEEVRKLTLCMLGNFSFFFSRLLIFFLSANVISRQH